MDPSPPEIDSLASYLDPFLTLAGDLRTVGVLAGTVPGIVDSGSAVWRRTRPVTPVLAAVQDAETRTRRTPHGKTTTRAHLEPDRLAAMSRALGSARPRGEIKLCMVFDGSDPCTSRARGIVFLHLMKRLDGPGQRLPNPQSAGMGGGCRGVRYHGRFGSHLSRGHAPDVANQPEQTRAVIPCTGANREPIAPARRAMHSSGDGRGPQRPP
ncbi:MAG: hypothetical protein M3440_15700 [Chloroflexota bacterium]|nr:hypothetical protein [Chloroflexota bacterium]